MALGYSPLAGPMPPTGVPGAVPPPVPGVGTPGGFPPRSSPPYRIGGGYAMPPWLQDKINAFNQLHTQAQAGNPLQHPGVPGAGAGWEIKNPGQLWNTNTGGGWPGHQPPPPGGGGGPTGPPVQPPDWQTYWQQWYQQRQPYADWLSGYVRGAY